jgi:recombination protein RecT
MNQKLAKQDDRPIQPWKRAVSILQGSGLNRLRDDLPEHIKPEHMIRSFVAAVRNNWKLADCSVESLLDGVATAAQLGLTLTPSMGHAALVPYGGECQFQPMYQGLISLAYRSGRVGKIVGRAVYEGDDFDYVQGTEEYIKHRPRGEADPAKLTHAYAVAWIIGASEPVFVVLNRAQIERARKFSKASRADAPWKIHYDAMAIKTAIKRLAKIIPKDPEDKASRMFAMAVQYDDIGRAALDQEPKKVVVEQLEDVEPPPAHDGPELTTDDIKPSGGQKADEQGAQGQDGGNERDELKAQAVKLGLVDDSCRWGVDRLHKAIVKELDRIEAEKAKGVHAEEPPDEPMDVG